MHARLLWRAACCVLALACLIEVCISKPLLYNAARSLPPYLRGSGRYQFVLQDRELLNGLRTSGSNERLRLKVDQFVNRQTPIKLTVIGGSITHGHGAEDAPSWPQYLFNYLEDNHPGMVTGHNGAVAASMSPYMSACHTLHIPNDTDIVFVEYTLNDHSVVEPLFMNDIRQSYERMLRKLLSYPNKPAVVLMHAFAYLGTLQCSGEDPCPGNYWVSAERELGEFALYYNLPELSVKGCCFHLMANNVPGFRVWPWRETDRDNLRDEAFYFDALHPDGRTGHRVMAELAINLLREVAASLKAKPLTEADIQWAHQPLPHPMIPNNYESMEDRCLIGDKFVQTVIGKEGFQWKDDTRPPRGKWGFISVVPNSTLTLRINTIAASNPDAEQHEVQVELAHLKSYQHMGKASVKCASGCSCADSIIDCHNMERHSLIYMHSFYATQSSECIINVTVLQETSSGEHKIKMVGVVVSDTSGTTYGIHDNEPAANFIYDARTNAQNHKPKGSWPRFWG